MIDINLAPSSLRTKRKSQVFGKINIPLEVIIGCGGGLLFLLGMIHVVLLLINVGKLAQHKSLQIQWQSMQEEKKDVDSVMGEMRIFQGQYQALENIVIKGESSWAQKLNLLSDNLPRGMWFKKIALNDKMLFIEGSAISQNASEMMTVSQLISNLKNSEDFMVNFSELELGSIQRRRNKNVEIADFVITMKLK